MICTGTPLRTNALLAMVKERLVVDGQGGVEPFCAAHAGGGGGSGGGGGGWNPMNQFEGAEKGGGRGPRKPCSAREIYEARGDSSMWCFAQQNGWQSMQHTRFS